MITSNLFIQMHPQTYYIYNSDTVLYNGKIYIPMCSLHEQEYQNSDLETRVCCWAYDYLITCPNADTDHQLQWFTQQLQEHHTLNRNEWCKLRQLLSNVCLNITSNFEPPDPPRIIVSSTWVSDGETFAYIRENSIIQGKQQFELDGPIYTFMYYELDTWRQQLHKICDDIQLKLLKNDD